MCGLFFERICVVWYFVAMISDHKFRLSRHVVQMRVSLKHNVLVQRLMTTKVQDNPPHNTLAPYFLCPPSHLIRSSTYKHDVSTSKILQPSRLFRILHRLLHAFCIYASSALGDLFPYKYWWACRIYNQSYRKIIARDVCKQSLKKYTLSL